MLQRYRLPVTEKKITMLVKSHARSHESSEKLKRRKKAVKNVDKGIYLLDVSLPGSSVTG